MGIDVYLRWDGQTEAEKEAQITGYSIVHGHVGYLREAYHGGPYATKTLMPEAWESDDENGVRINASVFRQRLSAVKLIVVKRSAVIYGEELNDDSPEVQSYVKFIELAEAKENEGKNPRVLVSY
jgi:hypothetical protein